MNILVALGTRPEAVKLAPVVLALRDKGIAARVLFTGQHKELALPILQTFGITPDFQFTEQPRSFELYDIAASYLEQAGALIASENPDLLLVQGDTTTAFAVALAGYYQRCPVGHVEAGLRTYNPLSPFPEENHRHMLSVLATLNFAPSDFARDVLLSENVPASSITVTGNTVIDALQWVLTNVTDPFETATTALAKIIQQPFMLVTAHRRENFGTLHERYFTALNQIALEHPQMQVVFVSHPNPNVRSLTKSTLTSPNIHIVEPVGYTEFIYLMRRSKLIITDSGGIQEESAFLGKPTLVIREHTDRKELLEQGNVIMVGADSDVLKNALQRLLTDNVYFNDLSRVKLAYGTGKASSHIVDSILQWQRRVSS